MAESPQFNPKKEFGSIPISDESEIKFYVDEYRGYTYASMRTFLRRSTYTGPTKAGITMNAAMLDNVIKELSKLPPQPEVLQDKELARFPRKLGTELVLRITIYKDSTGVDVREWVNDGNYEGWSKKGVRIPYAEVGRAIGFLNQMLEFLTSGS